MRLFWGLCLTIGLTIGLASIAGGAAADTLGKVRDSGKLVIGHREASRPFSFINDDGQVAGYSIDLSPDWRARMGYTLRLSDEDAGLAKSNNFFVSINRSFDLLR